MNWLNQSSAGQFFGFISCSCHFSSLLPFPPLSTYFNPSIFTIHLSFWHVSCFAKILLYFDTDQMVDWNECNLYVYDWIRNRANVCYTILMICSDITLWFNSANDRKKPNQIWISNKFGETNEYIRRRSHTTINSNLEFQVYLFFFSSIY